MAIFGSWGRSGPSLLPELDDEPLGKVRRLLESPPSPGVPVVDFRATQIERVLSEAGNDWDRRTHRISVLADVVAHTQLAESWVTRQPHNPVALTFQMWVTLARERIGPAGVEARSAIDACYRIAELRPYDPVPWIALLGILRQLRRESRDVFAIWKEATARDPWNRKAHLQMLGYLSPEECGSSAKMLDFAEVSRLHMPADAPATGVELVATIECHRRNVSRGGLNALLTRHWWTQFGAARVVDQALARWTEPGFLRYAAALADLNALAYALVQAGRLPDAAKVFRMTGRVATVWPWCLNGDPLHEYGHWKKRVVR
ncbi:hypothetical protein HUT19_16130 [Streptomyces sp. NA02950]|uniref:hypothetical protein n=1 Tax=Streptomyces sp. NA02950 TaxID=2742137 RepID=UPI00159197E1|nr:hypothetical protein [Streptomyces sp. NA02950]QKV93088.1 hypothetical protein HUT19_16130 [Streptomyces sp. NA02950]